MRVSACRLDGLLMIEPAVHADARGFFLESFRRDAWVEIGIAADFVQENHSRSRRGTVRGLHFQAGGGQAKLIRVARGKIHDVSVDIRRGSRTFGQYEAVELDDHEHRQLYIPRGFAHGFAVLSAWADVIYKVDAYYDPATERGIAFDDPDLGIQWPVDTPILSARDRANPRLADAAIA